ncbi:MAG: hypothetical protein KAU49_02875 [Candidatus Krumholzibacteria bacterium]|nr:hypothetical protein [Candidatus Krumholzibacteria bacterium]
MFRKTLIILVLLAVLPVLPSCLDETVKPVKEAPPITWPDMSSEEDAIRTLVMCYGNPSLEGVMTIYEDLLHSEYIFRFAPEDVLPDDPPILTRAGDIVSTGWIFENQSELELDIFLAGAWNDYHKIDGATCEGCRETMRGYFIRVQFGKENTVYQCIPDRAFVTIIVAPDESDASKWVIRAIYDHGT